MPSLLHSLAGAFVHALAGTLACALACALAASSAGAQARPFGVGRVARPAEVRARDISVAPDGTGLPRGRGSVAEGRVLYRRQCAMCHGDQGIPSGPQAAAQYPVLVGGFGTLTTPSPVQTVGSFWPYATTVWDYIHRAMPYQRPGTLRANEVYALTAYLLYLNHIVPRTAELSETTLPSIRMPNRDGFVSDPRPDVGVP